MSKDVYIALIQKDIKELEVISQGLYETDFPTPTVIKLASKKAMDIVNNLQRLANAKEEEQITISEENNRIAAELKAKQEKEEQERIAAELKSKQEKEEQERIAAELKAKQEKEEQERIAAELKAKQEKEEQERIAAELKAKQEKEEQERIAAELKAKQEKEEQERIAAEQKAKALSLLSGHEVHTKVEETIGTVKTKIEQITKNSNNSSIADKIASSKITNILEGISLLEKLELQRELFNNDSKLMSDAVEYINACNDIEEANNYLNDNFQDWDVDSEPVKKFLNLISRKF